MEGFTLEHGFPAVAKASVQWEGPQVDLMFPIFWQL